MVFAYFNTQLLLLPLYGFAIYGLVRYFSKRFENNDKENTVNWTPLESVGVAIAIYFLTQILAAGLLSIYGSLRHISIIVASNQVTNSTVGQFMFVLFVETATIWLLYGFLRRRGTSFRTIGWKRPRWRDLGYTLAGYTVYALVLNLIIFQFIQTLYPHFNLSQKQDIGFSSNINGPSLVLVFIALVILPPLVEEILMRGFLYTGLRDKLPKIIAALVTSGLFAAAHLPESSGGLLWVAAIDTFILSLVLVYLREKTGSLWASIGVHMIKNGLAFATLFIFHLG